MNHRPRRLLAPALAVMAVGVLVVVLVVTGSHTVTPSKHHAGGTTLPARTRTTTTVAKQKSTTTTPPPIVSAPQASTPNSATYDVAAGTFTLVLSATSSACWVDVSNTTTGATLFSGELTAGQSQSIPATGPVTVNVGAPSVFAASVNGTAVTLPAGVQTPFNIKFLPSVAGVG